MRRADYSPYETLEALRGITEIEGPDSNPLIMAMLTIDDNWPQDDDVPWCSGAMNFVCKLWRLPRSKSLRARTWLQIGEVIQIEDAEPGFDIVILKRAGDNRGPEVISAPGHVGFFAGLEGDRILVLGGNQGDSISIAYFRRDDLLGVRRLG